jgi:hypothetical protein
MLPSKFTSSTLSEILDNILHIHRRPTFSIPLYVFIIHAVLSNSSSRHCPNGRKCFNCDSFGHSSYECIHPKRDRSASVAMCRKCGYEGHQSKDCHTAFQSSFEDYEGPDRELGAVYYPMAHTFPSSNFPSEFEVDSSLAAYGGGGGFAYGYGSR